MDGGVEEGKEYLMSLLTINKEWLVQEISF